MSSKLFTDILSIIFEDLEQENDKALYPCLFVNREWCKVAIPLLWKNPWKKFEGVNKRANRYKILFKCFLMMMPKESKKFLKINGINLLIEDTSFQNNSPSLQTPLFNYASFCKVIDSFRIIDMIKYAFGHSLNQNLANLVEQEILKLLIGNTSKLKILTLHNKSHYPITSFPNSSLSLSQLNEFHCDTSIDVTIFYELSQLCRNIETLVIEGYINDDNHGLFSFIKQQINLKRVKICKDYDYRDNAQGYCKNLGEALATKTSSIIELDLSGVISIPPIFLKKFQNNLSIFKFGINYELVTEINKLENILRDLSLPNLQQLLIYNGCPFEIIEKIIKKTNGNLKKISIYANNILDRNGADSYIFTSAIAKHCPKLELLAIWVDNDLSGILELIKECKTLRGLALRSLYSNYSKQNIGKLLKILYNNASNQLRKLQLGNLDLSKEALNEFFENWRLQQRNSLDFYISSYRFESNYEDIIKKYQALGVIRKFEKYFGDYNLLDSWVNN